MAIQIEKSFQVKEPIEKVWSLLSDPRRVAACVPGAKITEQVDEKTYKGTISVKVGPSATDYKGVLEIVRLDAAKPRARNSRQRAGRERPRQRVDEDDGQTARARGWRHGGHKRF